MRTRIVGLMRLNRMKIGMLGIVIEKTPQTVSKRLQHPETFTVSELLKISKFFKVDLADLIGGWRHDNNGDGPCDSYWSPVYRDHRGRDLRG